MEDEMLEEIFLTLKEKFSSLQSKTQKLSKCEVSLEGCWSEGEERKGWGVCGHCYQTLIKLANAERDAARHARDKASKETSMLLDEICEKIKETTEELLVQQEKQQKTDQYFDGYIDACIDLKNKILSKIELK